MFFVFEGGRCALGKGGESLGGQGGVACAFEVDVGWFGGALCGGGDELGAVGDGVEDGQGGDEFLG